MISFKSCYSQHVIPCLSSINAIRASMCSLHDSADWLCVLLAALQTLSSSMCCVRDPRYLGPPLGE
jgi:hypothetical protein